MSISIANSSALILISELVFLHSAFLCQAAIPTDLTLTWICLCCLPWRVIDAPTGPRMVAGNICENPVELPSLRATSVSSWRVRATAWTICITAGIRITLCYVSLSLQVFLKSVSASLPEAGTIAGLSVVLCFCLFFYKVYTPILSSRTKLSFIT